MIPQRTIVIGTGFGGLAAALALSASGEPVLALDSAPSVGGKARSVSIAGRLIDVGPTVFTMRWVFERLFAQAGIELAGHVRLHPMPVLARHYWGDGHSGDSGEPFDLAAGADEARDAIAARFGARAAGEFESFHARAGAIHGTLRDTFMAAARPGPVELARRIGLNRPGALLRLSPFRSLASALDRQFTDPRLRQLYARYATYVGSSPWQAPATLMLIAHVEQQGVWAVEGGMSTLADAIARAALAQGAEIRTSARVERILTENGSVAGVRLEDGTVEHATRIVHAGDVSALGDLLEGRAPVRAVRPCDRSLSALTFAMRARSTGRPLHHHTVAFGAAYRAEFDAIFGKGRLPDDPTVYLCAPNHTRGETDVFALVNAPARPELRPEEIDRCRNAMHERLALSGLALEPVSETVMTTPADFARLFPGSRGAIYGRAQHGWLASFARPGARTAMPGLYLAGGSAHPGAGVPMATLSGMIAARQLLTDLASTARFRRAATPGGTQTRSARTAASASP